MSEALTGESLTGESLTGEARADAGGAADIGLETLPLRRMPTQARSRKKVADALAAAERVLADDGPEGITLPRVAAEAGLAVGSLYQYLPDREAIMAALISRYHARVEASVESAIAAESGTPPREDPVGYVIRAVADIYREEAPTRALRGVVSTAGIEHARAAHKERMSQRVRALVRAAGATVPRSDLDIVARVAFTAADAIMHEAFRAPEAEQRAMLAELERMLRAYLGLA